MQIIVQNESIGYSLGDVLNVSEDRGTRWIRKGYARAFEDAAPVADVKEEPIVEPVKEEPKAKKSAKKSAKKRAK